MTKLVLRHATASPEPGLAQKDARDLQGTTQAALLQCLSEVLPVSTIIYSVTPRPLRWDASDGLQLPSHKLSYIIHTRC